MEDLTGQVDTVDSISATEWNNLQQEFKNFIEAFVTMNVGDLNQLRKTASALSMQGQWTNCSGGTVAYVLGMNTGVAAPPAYATGQVFQFRPNANNTVGANTVNVGSLGVVSLVREDGSALQAGDLATTRDAVIRYDGTQFRLMDFTLAAGSADLPDAYIEGLTMGRNSAETTTFQDIAVQPGSCRDAANTMNIVSGTEIIKQFDASWASGTGAGGYPATALGARATDTWYRFFAIGRSDTGAVDFGFDSAANDDAAGLLSDVVTATGSAAWTSYRQLGWVKTTTGTADELEPFTNDPSRPNYFGWQHVPKDDFNGAVIGSGTLARTTETAAYIPPSCTGRYAFYAFNKANSGSAGVWGIIQAVGMPDLAPTSNRFHVRNTNPGPSAGSGATPSTVATPGGLGAVLVAVDSSSQYNVRWLTSASNAYVYAVGVGFFFER